MYDLISKLGVMNLASIVFAIIQWVNPNWPVSIKLSVSILLVGLVVIDRILPQQGRGVKLYFHVVLGVMQGMLLGLLISSSFFRDPIYEVSQSFMKEGLWFEPTYVPSGKTQINTLGYMAVMGCGALGGFLALCSKVNQFSTITNPLVGRKKIIFIALCLISIGGAATAGYGYSEQRFSINSLSEAKEFLNQTQAHSADGVIARDAYKSVAEALERQTLMMYVGFFILLGSLVCSAIYAASLLGAYNQEHS